MIETRNRRSAISYLLAHDALHLHATPRSTSSNTRGSFCSEAGSIDRLE
jgi:hypothetical protein